MRRPYTYDRAVSSSDDDFSGSVGYESEFGSVGWRYGGTLTLALSQRERGPEGES